MRKVRHVKKGTWPSSKWSFSSDEAVGESATLWSPGWPSASGLAGMSQLGLETIVWVYEKTVPTDYPTEW